MAADLWGKTREGDQFSETELAMFDSKLINTGAFNTIHFNRIYVGEEVERLKFANGAEFERVVE